MSENIGNLSSDLEFNDKFSEESRRYQESLDTIADRIERNSRLQAQAVAVGETMHDVLVEGAHLAAEAVSFVGEKLYELTIAGAGVADVEENFQRLSSQAGVLGSTMLGTLREGTHGTITDFELMKMLNKDLGNGLVLSTEQMRTMSQGAFALAQATGEDVGNALETVNRALLTGQPRALKQLGIVVDLEKAERDYASSLGTTTDHLSHAQKLDADRLGMLEKTREYLQRVGEQTDGVDEIVAQMQTSWHNFEEELGKMIAQDPVVVGALLHMRDGLMAALGDNPQQMIARARDLIETVAFKALDVATNLSYLGEYGTIALTGLYKVGSYVVGIVIDIAYYFEKVALAISEVLSIGGNLGPFADDVTRIKGNIAGLSAAYDKFAAGVKVADSIQDHASGVADAARLKIDGLRTAMEKAKEAQQAHNEESEKTVLWFSRAEAGGDAVAHTLGSTTGAFKADESAIKLYNTALQNANNLASGYNKTLDTMSYETTLAVRYLQEHGMAEKEIAALYHLTEQQVKAVTDQTKEMTDVRKVENTVTVGQIDNLNALGHIENDELRILHDTQAARVALNSSHSLTIQNYAGMLGHIQLVTAAEKEHYATLVQLDALYQFADTHIGQGLENVGIHVEVLSNEQKAHMAIIDRNRQAVNDLAQSFMNLGQVTGGVMGDALGATGQIVVNLARASQLNAQSGGQWGVLSQMMNENATSGERWAAGVQAAASAVQGGMNVWSATESHSGRWGNAGAGALAGAEAGSSFGPYGVAIGAAAGFVIGIVRGSPEWAELGEELGHTLGVSISDELSHTIEANEELFNGDRIAAETYSLAAIMQQVPATERNVNAYSEMLLHTFDELNHAVFTTDQAVAILDQNFGQMAQAGTDDVGMLNSNLREAVRLTTEMGLQSQAISQYIGQQSGNALDEFGGGLSAASNAMDQAAQIRQQMAAIDAQRNPLLGVNHPGSYSEADWNKMNALDAQWDQLHAKLEDTNRLIATTTIHSEAAAEAISGGLLGSLVALTDQHVPLMQAIQRVSPAVDDLRQQLTATGLDGGSAFDFLNSMVTLANDSIAGPALQSINSYSNAMVAMSNVGILNQETFSGLTSQITGTRQALLDQGFASDEVNLGMQQSLQQVWEEVHHNHMEVDDATQSILDQAEAQGVIGETHRSVSAQMLDASRRTADATEHLAAIFENNLAPAVDTAVGKLSSGMDAVSSKIGTSKKDLDDFAGSLRNIPSPDVSIRTHYESPSNVKPEAAGTDGVEHISDPQWFYSAGNEDVWFSGEGKAGTLPPGSGGGGGNDGQMEQLLAMHRDFIMSSRQETAILVRDVLAQERRGR